MEHKLYETGDHGAPEAILDRNGEVALDLCKICGGAERAMPTDCPGTWMMPQQLDGVSAGVLDYGDSSWVTPNKETENDGRPARRANTTRPEARMRSVPR